jgi:Family of unknown function (DUF6325)
MRGPIDYIVVGFVGNKFDGSILKALGEAANSGTIKVLALSLIAKDDEGNLAMLSAADTGDSLIAEFTQQHQLDNSLVTQEDVDEVGELLEANTSAGLLVVEQLWAKPLKQAILNANGFLISEGRIHPEAAEEISSKGE